MTIKMQMPLEPKEGEAIMWGLAEIGDRMDEIPDDIWHPLNIIRYEGYGDSEIKEAIDSIWEVSFNDYMGTVFTQLESLILRVCIENTSWVDNYKENPMTKGDAHSINEAKQALRSLALKFEKLGIEINHIAGGVT